MCGLHIPSFRTVALYYPHIFLKTSLQETKFQKLFLNKIFPHLSVLYCQLNILDLLYLQFAMSKIIFDQLF